MNDFCQIFYTQKKWLCCSLCICVQTRDKKCGAEEEDEHRDRSHKIEIEIETIIVVFFRLLYSQIAGIYVPRTIVRKRFSDLRMTIGGVSVRVPSHSEQLQCHRWFSIVTTKPTDDNIAPHIMESMLFVNGECKYTRSSIMYLIDI